MPAQPPPLLTPAILGQAMPDRVQLSIFADSPMARGDNTRESLRALAYFRTNIPGAVRHVPEDRDPLGQQFRWRIGKDLIRLGIGPASFSMAVTINPTRTIARYLGLPGRTGRHGNSLPGLLGPGADWVRLRPQAAGVIVDRAARYKEFYRDLVPRVFGLTVEGGVHANISRVELAYDFMGVVPEILAEYRRPFSLVFLADENPEGGGISGRLRKGERFTAYAKVTGVTRFEAAIAGKRVKEIMGSQRVPGDLAGMLGVLDALENRYFPVWLTLERFRRSPVGPRLEDLLYRLPRARDRQALRRIVAHLRARGKIRSVRANRGRLTLLTHRGLLEDLRPVTRLRGWRVAAPGTEALWRRWMEPL